MIFSVDDYEKAIVRIFDRQGTVVGTGFLVTPGYVLTCAHVVLQATGIAKGEFAEHQERPQEFISLEFPILAIGQRIQAKVIEWLPYSLESGDIAALKLLASEPEGARAVPLVVVSATAVEKDEHFVYGFGNNLGGRSDAYRPKTTVAGARFQLCKVGDPNDETIQAGFSGAPVWNQVRQCVIGMVATAVVVTKDEQKSKAYAIPTQELQVVLKKIDASYLHNLLYKSLEDCSNNDEKHRLKITIEATLRHCNPNGTHRSWLEQLKDLSSDRAPIEGWKTEGRLVHFAMMLVQMDDTPPHTYTALKTWIEQQCRLNFPALLDRITFEMKQQKVSSSSECRHLMVDVQPIELSTNELRVSLWAIPDRETYNPNKPPKALGSEKVVLRQDLPVFLRGQIRKLRRKPIPTIHLFVPRLLFDCDVEMIPNSTIGTVLGSEYPFVIRTNLKTHPIDRHYYDDWDEKWKQVEKAFENKTCDEVKPVDCSLPEKKLIIKELKSLCAAVLDQCNAVGELFDLVAEETALPVAIWCRDPQVQDQLTGVLDCIVKHLPDRIRQERDTAHKSKVKPLLGHHLSLVWEDPKIVPPDMQFDPEACWNDE